MKRMYEEAKKADFNSMDKRSLVSMLYFSEEFYTAGKDLIRIFAHITAYFLAIIIIAISCCFFESYIETIPLMFNIIIKLGILLYTISLISRGIKLYLKYEAFLKIFLQYILIAKMTLNKKNNNKKVSC